MGIASNAGGIIKEASRLGGAAMNSFKPSTWEAASQAAKATAETATKATKATGGTSLGGIIAMPFKAAFAAGRWMIEAPISLFILKPIKAVIGGVASFYEKSPRAAAVITGVAAVGGVTHMVSRSKAANLQENLAASQAMAEQAAATGSQQPSYMNSVSPQEAQLLEQRQQAATADASHVGAVNAAREKVNAPENVAQAI